MRLRFVLTSCLVALFFITRATDIRAQDTLDWITRLGSDTAVEAIEGIAAASSGNIYIVGTSDSSFGTPLSAHSGSNDMLLAKFNSAGVLQWHTFFGSTGGEAGFAIALDSNENVYITGYGTANFGAPVNPHSPIDLSSGRLDILIAKFSSAGAPLWHTFHGTGDENIFGGENDRGYGIDVDSAGNVYVTGTSEGPWGTPVSSFGNNSDRKAVALKLNNQGALQWNTFHGGGSSSEGWDIEVDSLGNVFVAGRSHDTWGSPKEPHSGMNTFFVNNAQLFRLDNDGALVWNTFSNGSGGAYSLTLTGEAGSSIWIAGPAYSAWEGEAVNPFGSDTEMAVARYNSNGNLIWQTFHGAEGMDVANTIHVRGEELYVTGVSENTWGTPVDAKASPSGTFCGSATELDLSTGELRRLSFQCGAAGIDKNPTLNVFGLERATIGAVNSAYQPLLGGISFDSWGTPIADFTGTGGFVAQLEFPLFPSIAMRAEGALLSGIGNGDDTPRPEDGTDLGGTGEDVGTVVQGYFIQNFGLGALQLTGSPRVAVSGTHASDFTVTQQPDSPVPPGGEARFEITFDPSAQGIRSATLTIESNDEDDAIYTFAIQGTGLPPQPEIVLRGNGIEIPGGSTTTSILDGTDLGVVPVGAINDQLFIIENAGTGTLQFTSNPSVRVISLTPEFNVQGAPDLPVSPGGDTSFVVRFQPDETGVIQGTVRMDSNDLDEDVYTFSVQGEGVPGYTIGGTINGLEGFDMMLSNDAGGVYGASFPGITEFTFFPAVIDGTSYDVTVDTQPTMPDQFCTVENGTGTIMSADITNVVINCVTGPSSFTVGGTVTGVTGSSIEISNNCEDPLVLDMDGPFEFSQPVETGGAYSVVVTNQPTPPLYCIVEDGSGTSAGANVTDVQVICNEEAILQDDFEADAACP